KSDVGVDWDGEHSVVRVAGVVHRPGVDEEMMSHLIVDGRKRETGVFEKTIRLGTSKDPASVDVEGITAKMVDGVLVIRVPKVEKTFEKKEVHVGGSSSPSPARSDERPEDAYMNEKDLLFDAADDEDRDMYDADPVPEPQRQAPTAQQPVPADSTMSETAEAKEKQRETKEEEAERDRDDRSETVGFEAPHNETTETLPRYEVEDTTHQNKAQDHHQQQHASVDEEDNMSDWEKYGSEDEASTSRSTSTKTARACKERASSFPVCLMSRVWDMTG
ncbi:Hsp20/alpha crystallin family, partial [Aspergillus sclerotialis]